MRAERGTRAHEPFLRPSDSCSPETGVGYFVPFCRPNQASRMPITTEQVTQLAPDSSSAAAGQKLKALKNWVDLGSSPEALWGKCQGSALYQVKVDLANLGSSCSCPSRKFPCKHVLGLMFLCADTPAALPPAEPPEWVVEWLQKRHEREQKKAAKAEASPKPVDEEAQQKRADQRAARVTEGLDRLDLWLQDLVRNGLAGLESRPPSFWEEQARRLVDAQAPGLAARVSALGELPGSAPDWPQCLLAELGRIQLLLKAWQRHAQLDSNLQAEVRQLLGWNVSQEELAQRTDGIADRWCVVGQTLADDRQLRVQRSWLLGRTTHRWALIVQFAAGAQPFAEVLPVGIERAGTIVYYPGVAQQRARLVPTDGGMTDITDPLPGTGLIDEFLGQYAGQLSRHPWTRSVCGLFSGVTIVPRANGWVLRDQAGQALPLAQRNHWKLLALTGGAGCDLAGEWDGRCLQPLGVSLEGRFRAL